VPQRTIDRFYAALAERGDESFGGSDALFNPTGVPDADIAVRVDTRPACDTKLGGILVHRTQIGELERIPEDLRWIHLDEECFTQPWPPGESVRTDLFESLEV
jgi:hypothetical protein